MAYLLVAEVFPAFFTPDFGVQSGNSMQSWMVACSSIFLHVRFTWACRIAIVHLFWRHSLFSLQIIDVVNPATSFFAHCCFWSWFGWIWTLSTLFFEPLPGQDPYGWPRCLHLLWHCRESWGRGLRGSYQRSTAIQPHKKKAMQLVDELNDARSSVPHWLKRMLDMKQIYVRFMVSFVMIVNYL